MRQIYLAMVLAAAGMLIGCDSASEQSTLTKAEARTLTGMLRNDSTSPQGMITGWIVNDESNNGDPVPVDVTGLVETAQRMAGNRVAVKGTMMERLDAGGAKNPVFVAESINPAP